MSGIIVDVEPNDPLIPTIPVFQTSIGTAEGLLAWYSCRQAQITTEERVASWPDRSPAARHMTQSTDGKRPLLAAADAGIRGRRPVYFAGPARGDFFLWPGTLPAGLTSAGKLSTVHVIKLPLQGGGAGTSHIFGTGTGPTNDFILYVSNTSPTISVLCGATGGRALASLPYVANTWMAVVTDWDPTTGRLSLSTDCGRTWVSDTQMGQQTDAVPVSIGGGYSSGSEVSNPCIMSLADKLIINKCLRDSANAALLTEIQSFVNDSYNL